MLISCWPVSVSLAWTWRFHLGLQQADLQQQHQQCNIFRFSGHACRWTGHLAMIGLSLHAWGWYACWIYEGRYAILFFLLQLPLSLMQAPTGCHADSGALETCAEAAGLTC